VEGKERGRGDEMEGDGRELEGKEGKLKLETPPSINSCLPTPSTENEPATWAPADM